MMEALIYLIGGACCVVLVLDALCELLYRAAGGDA